jgi:hypothetical protein
VDVSGCEDDKKLKVNFKSISCKVCNAPSSGFHFGAITCEGCKVQFFLFKGNIPVFDASYFVYFVVLYVRVSACHGF